MGQLRWPVTFFPPSLNLKEQRQTGKAVQRISLPAQTPFARAAAETHMLGHAITC
jgi:hypothetical protein